MSPTDPPIAASIPLTVTGASKDTTIVVYDSDNRIVRQEGGGGDVVMWLARGFYTVRATVGAESDDTFVRLDRETSIPAPLPARYSAAPIVGSALTHDYYSTTSRDLSRTKTRGTLTSSSLQSAELFVFVRALDRDSHRGDDLAKDLQLLDVGGLRISAFAKEETKRDTQYGWLAFCAEAAPGFYRLAVGGARPRQIAVHLFPNWQTQVFVLHAGRPLVESLRVFMSPVSNGFEPDDEIAAAVDGGLRALQSGTAVVPEATLDLFLHNKFKNPMLGFIGAHLLIRAARLEPPDSPSRIRRTEIMREVLGNLAWLAPNSPDTVALEVLAHQDLGLSPPNISSVSLPPMLRAGYSALVAAAARNPSLVPDESLSDDISDRVISDSPWTSWEPRKTPRLTTSSTSRAGGKLEAPSFGIEGYTLSPGPGRGEGAGSGVGQAIGTLVDLGAAVIGGLKDLPTMVTWPWRRRSPAIGWLEGAVFDEIFRGLRSGKLARGPLDAGGIAQRLGVSPHAVRRVLESLNSASLDAMLEKAGVDAGMRETIVRTSKGMSDSL